MIKDMKKSKMKKRWGMKKSRNIRKSEGITPEEVDAIDQSFKSEWYSDTAGWVEYSNELGFVRPWWVIHDVSPNDFGDLQKITELIIPSKFQYGVDYEFSNARTQDSVCLNFLIPYLGSGYSASAKKSRMMKSRSSIAKFDGKLSEYANSVYAMAQNIDYGNVQLAQAGIQLDYDLADKLSRLTEELEDYYAKLNDFATEFDTRYIDADYEASVKKSVRKSKTRNSSVAKKLYLVCWTDYDFANDCEREHTRPFESKEEAEQFLNEIPMFGERYITESDTYQTLDEYYASAKKSYVPDYKPFSDMVKSLRGTRDNRNVFNKR